MSVTNEEEYFTINNLADDSQFHQTYNWCTTITWDNSGHQLHPELDAERKALNTRLFNEGSIKRQPIFVDDATTKRFWPTEEIASFYVSEMRRLAAKYNVNIVSAVVENTITE